LVECSGASLASAKPSKPVRGLASLFVTELRDHDIVLSLGTVSVSVLLVTYQAVPLDVLASAVHVNGAELDEFIKKHDGWKREGSLVSLPLSEFNQARQVKATEQLDRKKVANILAVLTK